MSAFIMTSGSGVLNLNNGAGVQKNYSQSGGSGNTQFNAETIYYNHPPPDSVKNLRESLLLTNPVIDRDNLIKTKGQRVPGTCTWILENGAYRSWTRGDTQLLWIRGGPGKGKTIISIFLTEELEKNKNDPLFYFCSGEDEKRNNACAVLRGLLWQISGKHQQECTKHMLPYFENPKEAQAALSSPETLWTMFVKTVRDPALAMTFCVLDGLDECDQDSIQWLVGKLVELTSASNSGTPMALRLIIVSRHGIPGLLSSKQVQLDPDADESINADIKTFVSTKVQELSKQIDFDDEFRDWLQSVLLDRAEGTFLWVGFAMIELFEKQTRIEITEAVVNLPKGLFEIYGRILLRINPKHTHTAAEILLWVVTAFRPLSLLELASAVGCKSSNQLSIDAIIRDWVDICKPFLSIKDNKVVLVHKSAKDYLLRVAHDSNPVLEKFRVKSQEAHLRIARACLDCIGRTQPSTVLYVKSECAPWSDHPDFNKEPLIPFAFMEWPAHARAASSSGKGLLDHPSHFFDRESDMAKVWWQVFNQKLDLGFYPTLPASSLHIACYLGHVPWVRALCRPDGFLQKLFRRVNKKDIDFTPLWLAASNGYNDVVTLLLDHGADINAKSQGEQTALHCAASRGYKEVVKVLLDHRATVDATDKDNETALHGAAFSGTKEVVEILLDYKATVDAMNVFNMTALHYAACFSRAKGSSRGFT